MALELAELSPYKAANLLRSSLLPRKRRRKIKPPRRLGAVSSGIEFSGLIHFFDNGAG